MKVLGVHNGHDPSAALVVDGEVVAFVEEERLSRVKHGVSMRDWTRTTGTRSAPFPHRAVAACLAEGGLRLDQLDAIVATHDEPGLAGLLPGAPADRVHAMPPGTHHLAHAFATFHASGFPDAAVLVWDHTGSLFERTPDGALQPLGPEAFAARRGPGADLFRAPDTLVYESESVFGFAARDAAPERVLHHVHPLAHIATHGFGALYAACCAAVGLVNDATGQDEAGKLMGLAAHGTARGHGWGLLDATEPPFDFGRFAAWSRSQRLTPADTPSGRAIAAEAQGVLEHAAHVFARWIRATTGHRRLCVAGGVGLNVPCNAIFEQHFDEVFVLPCCTDAGNALGAAFAWVRDHGGTPQPLATTALGPTWSDAAIDAALEGLHVERMQDEALIAHVADRLAEGQVVAWFDGRSEVGPRALGHRSLLADPRPPDQRDRLNVLVKGREPFRPLAPSILAEHAPAWFGVEHTPYMLRAATVAPERRARVPAVVHADGSTRPQTVRATSNPRYHALIDAFRERTGVPLVLNTSLNGPGVPMVESPDDAVDALWTLEIDALVFPGRLVHPPAVDTVPLRACIDAAAAVDRVLGAPRQRPWLAWLRDRDGLARGTVAEALKRMVADPLQGTAVATPALDPVVRRRLTRFLLRHRLLFRP